MRRYRQKVNLQLEIPVAGKSQGSIGYRSCTIGDEFLYSLKLASPLSREEAATCTAGTYDAIKSEQHEIKDEFIHENLALAR